ncbi:hypothetical protein HIM_09989 [Hirsutella minnesotensis 3608]|uniref:Uncharacterized protein n=1 Tax=Hirsutella minnesotensis 3608 TaxID=1043627 RepID=A0A0F7ZGB5_9HYPO|nr:hypothetical protein HIM_09989 [Hirsutella minnesotensis 3608]
MADDIPPVLQIFLEKHLEKPEREQIIKQFELTWVPEKQILWTGMTREVAQGWANRNNMQTLTTAMGPLMDKSHLLCPKNKKGKKRWTKYVHGASALFAWRISKGESVTVLSRPPPERFHPSNCTSFQVIELPIVTGKFGNRSVKEIRIIHPGRPETTGFSYQLWPLDAVSSWISAFGVSRNSTAWRQVNSKPDMIQFSSTSTHSFTHYRTVSSSMELPPHDITEQRRVDYADMMAEQQRSHIKRKGTKDGDVPVPKQKKSKKQRVNSRKKAEKKQEKPAETPPRKAKERKAKKRKAKKRKAKKRKAKKLDSGGITERVRQGGGNGKGNLEELHRLASIEANDHRTKIRFSLENSENSHGIQHSGHSSLNVQENEMLQDEMIKAQYYVESSIPAPHKKNPEGICESGTNSSSPFYGNQKAKDTSRQAEGEHEDRILDKDQGQNGGRALLKLTIFFTKLISRINKGASFTRQLGNMSFTEWLQRSDVTGYARLDRPGYTGSSEPCPDTSPRGAGSCENIL